MGGSVPLGRIAGVRVKAHWSVLIILVLVADALATGVLPATVKDATAAAYWIVGVAVALSFFASLLAHEIAHAVVAKRHGMTVRGITLWMLGGATMLDGRPTDASADLRIAVAGPLVSFGCAAVSLVAGWGLEAVGVARLVVVGFLWLAATNALLGAFNLLPGAPLDGGRVLRAFLWRRTGDEQRADLTAAWVGRATGAGLVVLGALDALTATDIGSGLWLGIVGWFLIGAASAEATVTKTRLRFGQLRVRDVMDPEPRWLPAYQPVANAAVRVIDSPNEWAMVCDMDGKPVGVVAVERIVHAAVIEQGVATVGQFAIPLVPRLVAGPDELVADAVLRAGTGVPIVAMEEERVVGLVSPRRTERSAQRARLETAGSPA